MQNSEVKTGFEAVGLQFACLVTYIFVCLLRIRESYDRLPPDPGFWFIEQARDRPLLQVFNPQDGFIHIAPRLMYEAVVSFDFALQAVVSSVLMQLVFALTAFLVFNVVRLEKNNPLVAFFSGLIITLIPAASESTVGNLGSVKWPLTIGLVFVFASRKFQKENPIVSLFLIILVGLSQPYSIFLLVFTMMKNIFKKNFFDFSVFEVLLSLTFLIQVATWLGSGVALQKYGEPTYLPWSGMGLFWYSIWLTPFLSSIFLMTVCAILSRFFRKHVEFEARLAIAAALLSLFSYLQLGIKDSSAVAPQGISWVALLLVILAFRSLIADYLFRMFLLCLIFLMSVSSAKWFFSSWYLSSGPTWSSEVKDARNRCRENRLESTVIVQFMGDKSFLCSEIVSD